MKAVLIDKQTNALLWADVPDPVLGEDDCLIEIHAAALNRADLMQRAGDYPPPPGCPEWMGLEISGVIVEMADGAKKKSNWKIGDKVCALLGGGGYAEYANVKYDMLMPIPAGCSFEEAAAIPEAYATAYLNLFHEGGLKPGYNFLMHAGASGLASVVIPMAKAFGAHVITTVISDEAAKSITNLGADLIVNTKKEDIHAVLRAERDAGRPLDLAIDCLGGDFQGECLQYMRYGGRWIMIATLAGDNTTVNLKELYKLNVRLIGSTLRSKSPEFKAMLLAELVRDVWPKIEAGQIKPTIYKILPITAAEEAHGILQRCENVGKVVLKVK
ncbi:MAG: NAD(P)H-quinone oxidoreductase [Clostridia bacterium]|nr:NAD(P)H-quinone oxidoreductase [Clostridia bacterium]